MAKTKACIGVLKEFIILSCINKIKEKHDTVYMYLNNKSLINLPSEKDMKAW